MLDKIAMHTTNYYTPSNAPLLAKDDTPEAIEEAIYNCSVPWAKIAQMAAKSENTKTGPKVRETWSADAITRELTTEYDQAAIPLSKLLKGVTSRKTEVLLEGIFAQVNNKMQKNSSNVTASIDTRSLSPSAPRAAWARPRLRS